MRDMRRYVIRFLIPVFVAVAAAIFVPGAGGDGSWWTLQTSGVETNLRGVSGALYSDAPQVDAPVVWASGSNGVILQSVDEGKKWKRISVPGGETLDFRSIQGFDRQKAYVMSIGNAGNSRIYKTIDGGASWKLQYTDPRKELFLDAMVCTSQIECHAVGDPINGKFVILRTRDGEKWEQLPADRMPDALPNEGAFAASGTCLAIYNYEEHVYFVTGGPAARLFHSSDAGYSWTVNSTPIVSSNPSSGIFSIAVWDKALVVVGGDYMDIDNSRNVAAYSVDQGKTWKLAEGQPGGFRSAVARLNEKYLVAVGPNGEDVSDDGGAHWRHTDSLNLNAMAVLPNKDAWAVGPHGTIARLKSSPTSILH
jgi:photosystem II stability/assembly factor-like uncharacterized protein